MEPNRTPAPSPRRSLQRPTPSASVRAIARAAGRGCSRPGCTTPAAATLVFSYAESVARLVDLLDERDPQTYDLCAPHADRTRPPLGWDVADTRTPRSDAPRELDDDETVAVLAAALRGEAPAARVTVVPGERVDAPAPDTADALVEETAADDATPVTGGGGGDGPFGPDDDGDEDPLRAALEEVQRVAAPDPDTPGAEPTPLRAEDDLTLW